MPYIQVFSLKILKQIHSMVQVSVVSSNCARFETILRRLGLLITDTISTTVTKTLFVILHWIPVDLQAKKHAR